MTSASLRLVIYGACMAALCVGPTSAQDSIRKVERPVVKEGDTWTYQTTDVQTQQKNDAQTFTVVRLEGDRIILQSGGDTLTFTADWNFVETKRGALQTNAADPYLPRFQFPLEPGKTWELTFRAVGFGGTRQFRQQWKVTVEGTETITVPAGTFETIRLRQEGFYNCSSGCNYSGRRSSTYWYAPAVGREVKEEIEQLSPNFRDHSRRELISFTRTR